MYRKVAHDCFETWRMLNFGAANSGFIVKQSIGPTILSSFSLTTANDAPERDPSSWTL